jgi:hypothetical protein
MEKPGNVLGGPEGSAAGESDHQSRGPVPLP